MPPNRESMAGPWLSLSERAAAYSIHGAALARPAAPQAAPPLRLNVGCGSTAPATWINIDNSPTVWLAQRPWIWRIARRLRLAPDDMLDAVRWADRIVRADATGGLPFAAGSVDAIYASHFLEHLSRDEAVSFLGEARRLLRPGGLLRVVVPDLTQIVAVYHQASAAGDEHAADTFFENLWVVDKGLTRYPRWFRPLKAFLRTDVHRWMYDRASLTALLGQAGFVQIEPRRFLESDIPALPDVESAFRLEGAICLEARQPGPPL
jgi:SAM-dependent methyltransferase